MEPLHRLPSEILPSKMLPSEIDDVLSRDGIVLTGNQRAARTLRLDFDRQRRTDGLASWRPPAIFAWDTWLVDLWQQVLLEGNSLSGSDRLLLNRTQELQLWRSIISADTDYDSDSKAPWSSLQSVHSLASMAASAWQQLCAYRGQYRLNALGVSGDTRTFQRWAQTFVRRCKTDLYLSASDLESALIQSKHKPAATELLLVGFDDLTPAQQALLGALRETGVSVFPSSLAPVALGIQLAAAKDLDDEIQQAALWLRHHLEANLDARIAVIHPDIAAERAEVDRVFRRVLAPQLNDIAADPTTGPYEFSLGTPLSRQPMIAIALKLLRWIISPLPLDEISHLLLSPYFASRIAEHYRRAEFDAFGLRRAILVRPELEVAAFIRQIAGDARRASSLGGLMRQLTNLQRATTRLLSGSKQKSFAEWADSVRELLHAADWATATLDTSIEFQTRRKWESVLDELATLDFEGARATFLQALEAIEQIALRTLFAPESREAPIQIMGPLEAAGSRFDALYFLRASDLAWPTRPGLDPLLGWRLQRDLHMPGSDAAQDFAQDQRITMRLAASARTVIFSYALETAEAHQRPSPTLDTLSLTPLDGPQAPETSAVIPLEDLEDPGFIPLASLKVRGGAEVLKLQAACGFRAFAEKRLWSTSPRLREPGMDAVERGNVVHVALDHLWQEIHTQKNLRALTTEQRTAALYRSIDGSLTKFKSAAVSDWDFAYLDLQRERLHRLLSAWLDIELTRSPFEVRLREQEEEDVAIGPLLLSLRVDRIDRVFSDDGEDLGEVVLDYKTGLVSPSAWKTERPEEPQLPLYAAVREAGSVAGIAFASLRPGKDMDLRGVEAYAGVLPKAVKFDFETLDDQIAEWHRILTGLAIDFADGNALVHPRSYPITCEHCQQRILCRLNPTTLEDLIEEADEADA